MVGILRNKEIKFRVLAAMYGAIIFLLIFDIFPDVYYKYLDKTEYFVIYSVDIEGEDVSFQPCDIITVSIDRESRVNAQTEGVREFIKIVNENSEIEVAKEKIFGAFDKGRKTVSARITLPCSLEEGDYIISSLLEYNVRNVPKSVKWETPQFTVASIAK